MYYRSNVTGCIISGGSIRILDDVYGKNGVMDTIKNGTITPIEDPTVMECILHGSKVAAYIRYRETHTNCTLSEARTAVEKMEQELKAAQGVEEVREVSPDCAAERPASGRSREPLTLDELRKMKGEPVWFERMNKLGAGCWMLAYRDCACNRLGVADYLDYGKTWLAYREPEVRHNEQ